MPEKNPMVLALEAATQRAIALDAPLRDRLQIIADEVRALSGEFASAVDVFVARLKSAEAGEAAPNVGDPMPDFVLPDQTGRLVRLDSLRAAGPVVVAFLRGHWCPYCKTTAASLGALADSARAQGARIVAITPEHRRFSALLASDAGGRLPVLADIDNGYALSLNLAVWVDDAMSRLIAAAGWDVPSYQVAPAWLMPIPATFVVDRTGIIRARHVDPDYRLRMEPRDITAALAQAALSPA